MEVSYQVYVLQSSDGKFYIGLSEDVDNRLLQHNSGESKWTAKYRPWELVWQSEPMEITEARKLENKLKRAKGGNSFYAITGLNRGDTTTNRPGS